MANELQYRYASTGRTLYAVIRNRSGQVWQTTTTTFVTQVNANWANYDTALTESPAGGYLRRHVPVGDHRRPLQRGSVSTGGGGSSHYRHDDRHRTDGVGRRV